MDKNEGLTLKRFIPISLTICLMTACPSLAAPDSGMPSGALQAALQTGFDIEPDFQFGLAVDGYIRLTTRFSLGLRVGIVNGIDRGDEDETVIVPQIPLSVLLSWDFLLPKGRVMVPLTLGTGITLNPTDMDYLFIEMLSVETGVKIRLVEKVWLAVLAGSRALYFFHEGTPVWPQSDFHFLLGPYIRF
jgi:hypothetical protein